MKKTIILLVLLITAGAFAGQRNDSTYISDSTSCIKELGGNRIKVIFFSEKDFFQKINDWSLKNRKVIKNFYSEENNHYAYIVEYEEAP